jgi:hypothetical protein
VNKFYHLKIENRDYIYDRRVWDTQNNCGRENKTNQLYIYIYVYIYMPGKLLSTLVLLQEWHTATPNLMCAQREGNLRRQRSKLRQRLYPVSYYSYYEINIVVFITVLGLPREIIKIYHICL